MPSMFPNEDPSAIRRRYKPDVITGDMDSVREEILEFYANMGTEIINLSQDQNTTDLHKCVALICSRMPEVNNSNLAVLVTGALGGRFDHEMGNINVLYRFPQTPIILLSDDCLIYLLSKGYRHEIIVQSSVEGPHCGLIPIGAPCASTTTSGLQWDLSAAEMHFGGVISTSNIVREEKITISSDSDILWTISIRRPSP
ncbi:thiamine pyrophosphokinase1 isoform X2 [Wolffia australiana]